LPSIKWAVVYGVVLTLARSLGEFGAVKIVSGNITGRTQTATLVVEAKYQNFQQSSAYATSFLLIFVSVACIIVVAFLRPKDGGMRHEIDITGSPRSSGTSSPLDNANVPSRPVS
jgi:sulfate transport system permease protein